MFTCDYCGLTFDTSFAWEAHQRGLGITDRVGGIFLISLGTDAGNEGSRISHLHGALKMLAERHPGRAFQVVPFSYDICPKPFAPAGSSQTLLAQVLVIAVPQGSASSRDPVLREAEVPSR